MASRHEVIRQAVHEEAEFVPGNDNSHQPPKPVKIRLKSSGNVCEVPMDTAIIRLEQDQAVLVTAEGDLEFPRL